MSKELTDAIDNSKLNNKDKKELSSKKDNRAELNIAVTKKLFIARSKGKINFELHNNLGYMNTNEEFNKNASKIIKKIKIREYIMSRKKTEEYILKSFKISKNTHNILVDFFKGMTDKEFHQFMLDVQNKVKNLSFVIPHEEQHKESDILDWCESIGVKPFQKLTYVYEDGFEHTIDIKTFIIDAIVKRAAQTQDKKVSIPTGNKINSLTGQVTGDSLSAQFTLPETLITIGFGAKKAPNELINARGGDLGLLNAMYKELFTNGRVSMEEIKPYSTKNVTTKTLKAYLLASHIKSTL